MGPRRTSVPTAVLDQQGAPVANVLSGISFGSTSMHSCAIFGDGSLSCWGANRYGQIGNGRARDGERTATPVRW